MKIALFIFALGAFSSLAMAPANLYPALFVGLSGLYIFLNHAPTPLKAGISGFIFSLGYFGFSLSWVGNALLIEDNPYWWAYPIAVSGLPIVLSIFTAISCCLYKTLCKNKNNIASHLIFTILISLAEYARGHLLTGFPWNLYGYTWIEVLPIAQLASLWNIYLLTAVTIFWCAAPAFLISSNHNNKIKLIAGFLIISTFIASYIFGINRINSYSYKYYEQFEVVVIQPNIKQSEKWLPEKIAQNFTKEIELSKYKPDKNTANKEAYYIIWPETAISQDFIDSTWAMDMIKEMLGSYPNKAYLITGILRYNKKDRTYFNSVITINNNAEIINIYDKSHLVPFGEYMPMSNIFDIAPIVGFTGFKKGKGATIQTLTEEINFLPLVCYEIIFPINKELKPDFIINVTNDAWYGSSAGPYQHLIQAKFRAIESGTTVIRSANTGISAIISPIGTSQTQGSLSKKSVLIEKIPFSFTKLN